jgi:hypothetical protein
MFYFLLYLKKDVKFSHMSDVPAFGADGEGNCFTRLNSKSATFIGAGPNHKPPAVVLVKNHTFQGKTWG